MQMSSFLNNVKLHAIVLEQTHHSSVQFIHKPYHHTDNINCQYLALHHNFDV